MDTEYWVVELGKLYAALLTFPDVVAWAHSNIGLTVIADLAAIDGSVKAQSQSIYQNTFNRAQNYNLQMEKVIGAGNLPWTYYGHHWPYFPKGWPMPPAERTGGFLNGYYDDEGWWYVRF